MLHYANLIGSIDTIVLNVYVLQKLIVDHNQRHVTALLLHYMQVYFETRIVTIEEITEQIIINFKSYTCLLCITNNTIIQTKTVVSIEKC